MATEDAKDTDAVQSEKLGWRAAFSDVWFFPGLFLAVFGGSLPIIALMHAVGVEHNFVAPIQAIIDAYQDGTVKLGAIVEPHLMPFIHWLGGLFGWHLYLYPHWRHLLILALVGPLAYLRVSLREDTHDRLFVLYVFLYIMSGTSAAVIVGLVDTSGGWIAQGLIAGLSYAVLTGPKSLLLAVDSLLRGDHSIAAIHALSPAGALLFFATGAGLSLLPKFAPNAGLVVLGSYVVFSGLIALHFEDAFSKRLGITTLGGFIGTGFVFLADWLLKMLMQVS